MLEINGLSKSYGSHKAVDNLSMRIANGEIHGFIGHNGAGKTTTLRSIAGIMQFEEGTITIDGHSIKEEPLACKKIMAYIPDNPDLYEFMSGIQYLNFIADIFGVDVSTRDERIHRYTDLFEITNVLDDAISSYSHGMKQKVCLMASLIHNPAIWILDEPTVGLDIIVYQTLMDMLREFAANGKTVFITSHNIDLVSRICNRVAIINNGVVAELIDFSKEPLKRRNLSNIFFSTYAVEKKPE